MHKIEKDLQEKILILDGAMGTMVQTYQLSEKDYRGHSFLNFPIELKGNTDILNITKPEVIKDIYIQYLNAGANILCTNTFGANRISQADYTMSSEVYEMNFQGARIARQAIEENGYTESCYVAGAMGPTTKLASMSPIIGDPGYRSITFDELVEAYTEQAIALIDGGIDLFLLETITDTLNAKAALFALDLLFENLGQSFPVMVSGTITDASGRILSGQTVEAFVISVSHIPLLSIGLNCALGAAELRPYVEILNRQSPYHVSVHPNAGLPNQFGQYDQTPEELAEMIKEFSKAGWLNIVGGCCGTTPQHIRAIARAVQGLPPRKHAEITSVPQAYKNDIQDIISNWKNSSQSKPTFTLKEILAIIGQIEDKKTFMQVKSKFEQEVSLYHKEQELLIGAHMYGRFQYLKSTNNFKD